MELFLLLSALICGLTGTVRTAVTRAPEAIIVSQFAPVALSATRAASVRALILSAARPVVPRPDGYVAPAVFVPIAAPLPSATRAAPERRRE